MKTDFTLEDILEEQRLKREAQGNPAEAPGGENPGVEVFEDLSSEELSSGEFSPEDISGEEAFEQEPLDGSEAEGREFAGGEFEDYAPEEAFSGEETVPQESEPEYTFAEPEPEPPKEKKKKKKRWSLFGHKKKVPDFDENEEDIYYGIQLKPIDEYRLDGDAPPLGEEGYKVLFDDSKAIDDEVEENFQRLQRERRRRVAEAVQSAGMDEQQVEEEFGVVAPVPLTSYAADPYARQHGLDLEGQEDLSDLQKAMLQTDQTMEIKLNVLNSTVELQKLQDGQPVSEETVDRILASAPPAPPEQEYTPEPAAEYVEPEYAPEPAAEYVEPEYTPEPAAEYVEQEYAPEPAAEYVEQEYTPEPAAEYVEQEYTSEPAAEYVEQEYTSEPAAEYVEQEYTPEPAAEYVKQEYTPEPAPEYVEQERPARPSAEYGERERVPAAPVYAERQPGKPAEQPEVPEAEGKTIEMPKVQPQPSPRREPEGRPEPPPRPIQQVPYVETIYQYRSRNIPTHIIQADLLQSALLSESESLQRVRDALQAQQAPRRRVKPRKTQEEPPQPEVRPQEQSQESIEDYTGPEDARSISNELRGEMHKYSLTMMITGVCTLILAVVSVVCRSRFVPKAAGSWPLAYVVLTLIFLIVSAGISYKTVIGGLRGLFCARANADSALAVAVTVSAVQTVFSLFFLDQLVEGGLHLYAPVVSALLFLNAGGKLTMLRRIHSNFRFVTSREQKYAVRTFDDYNTSLKMTKDCVAEKPLIAYQCKTEFLKRFLELSYAPDPSESSSQLLAPLGLISSLVLCIACLLITKDVPTSIGALSAACCACVAAGNMLSVNLPVSNMCKTVRRAGGMAVGYEAVEAFGDVNAVIADAGDLFPTGTVVLAGIKTFSNKVLTEDAFMCASALMKELGGPLSGVFDQVISENEDILPEVDKISYESGAGAVGRVDGRTVYIGNRGLLINHRLEPPSREEETQYASGNKNVIYIAVDADVVAMMVLTYSADRRRKNELQRLEDSGISVLVRTTDPNVTGSLVSRLFGVDSASVGILDGQLGDTADQLTRAVPPRVDAAAATKGRMESMMSLIAACVEQKRVTGMLVAIQSAAVILGFVLVALLSCFGEVRQVSSLILFIFQMFWVGLLILLPRLRR